MNTLGTFQNMRRVPLKLFLSVFFIFMLLGPAKGSVFNAPCKVNQECAEIYNEKYECVENRCIREKFTYGFYDMLGFGVVLAVSAITNAGGVGAGTIIIPCYIVFFNFVTSDAIPLSRVTIFSGSLVNYILNFRNRDPHSDKRFLINYTLASVMMPLLLSGTQLGVMLARFLPSAGITLVLILYLINSLRQIYKRGKRDYIKETQQMEMKEKEEEIRKKTDLMRRKLSEEFKPNTMGTDSSLSSDFSSSKEEETIEHSTTELVNLDVENSTGSSEYKNSNAKSSSKVKPLSMNTKGEQNLELSSKPKAALLNDSQLSVQSKPPIMTLFKQQWENIVSILFAFFILSLSAFARGGEGRESFLGFSQCGKASWGIFIATQLFSVYLGRYSYKINEEDFKEEDKAIKDKLEVAKRMEMRKKLLWASYATGILAGLLGVGGGMILGLYMLSLGMDAVVSTALSTFVVLFSSCATTIQFVVAGAIHARHAQVFMCLSLTGSLIGNLVIKGIVRKYKRPSILIWILFSVLCVATCVLPVEVIHNLIRKAKSAFVFGTFC